MRHSDDEIARRLRRFLWFDEQPVPDTGFFRTLDEALWKPLLSAEGAADPRLDSIPLRQSARNELLVSVLGRMSAGHVPGSGDRRFFMEHCMVALPGVARAAGRGRQARRGDSGKPGPARFRAGGRDGSRQVKTWRHAQGP